MDKDAILNAINKYTDEHRLNITKEIDNKMLKTIEYDIHKTNKIDWYTQHVGRSLRERPRKRTDKVVANEGISTPLAELLNEHIEEQK